MRVFAACREGLYASDDLGYSFRRLTSAPANVRDVATSMFDSGTVVTARRPFTESGIGTGS